MRKATIIVPLVAAILSIALIHAGEKRQDDLSEYQRFRGVGDNEIAVAWKERTYKIVYAEDPFCTFNGQGPMSMMPLAVRDVRNTIEPTNERYVCTAKRAAAHPIVAGAQAVYTPSSDLGEVESIARDYIEGWYTGDVARVARALHDDLVKRMPVHEGSPEKTLLHPVSKARMLELTAQGGGENPDAVFEIIIDDISRDIATARVASPEYLDYLQLAKTSSGWKIVNVLFHMHD